MYRLLLTFILLFTFGAKAHLTSHPNVNNELNKTYQNFSQAFSQLDTELVEHVYAEDACYISSDQSKEIAQGRKQIISLYSAFFGRIRNKNARVEVDFRVVERQVAGSSATDIGYYLVRFHPSEDTEEPISEFAGKFVIVSKKNDDGKWYLSVETSNKAEPSFYYNAKPSPELYYGEHFTPLAKN